MLYSAGPCSVCGEIGDAIFVRAVDTGRIFFLCPGCGVAWADPPTPFIVDVIKAPEDFAPAGFTAASAEQISASGLANKIAAEYPPTDAERLSNFSGFERG